MQKIQIKKIFPKLLLLILLFKFPLVLVGQNDKKIELTSIEFIGNDFFDSSELKKAIVSKESPYWLSKFFSTFSSFGSPAIYFDSLSIQDDLEILNTLYQASGFFKVDIKASYSIEGDDDKEANLVFEIKENAPFFLRNYNFLGVGDLPFSLYTKMLEMVNIDTTFQYSEQLVEENNSIIIEYLQNKGYMLVGTQVPVVEIDTLWNVVDVSVQFNLGERYRISSVKVEKEGAGKDLVSDDLISEIVNIKPNKFYNYRELKLAQVRLYRTNLFSSAAISGSIDDTVGNQVPINIITKVGLLNELSPELILINEDNTLKLGLGFSYINKNFLGDARKLTIGTSAAASNITEFINDANLKSNKIFGYADARISVEQPFLFGRTINTLLETFYTLEKKRIQWNAKIYGAKLNLNFELPAYIYLTSLSSYFTVQHSEFIFKEKYLKDRLKDLWRGGNLTTKSTNAILGVNLVSNNTDDLLFPTEGYSISILAEDGNSLPLALSKIGGYNYSGVAYLKFVLTTSAYLPFTKKIFDSFGAKIKVGNIHTYSGERTDLLYNQRFTAGGSNSIRGWGTNDLPIKEITTLPENPTQNEIENIARNITPGGFFLLEGSIEAREHLSEKVGIALFLDYGNVWDHYNKFRYDEIAIAAGFGFRYYLDFAPIRLDIGFKAYNPDDKRSFFTRMQHLPFFNNLAFQLGIGEAF